MRVGIVGCGLIGRRRAAVARELGDRVVAVADIDAARAQQVAAENGCEWMVDWREVVARGDIDAVVVSTVNKVLSPVTIAAAQSGKHVLCEKPLGRNADEAQQMMEAARKADVVLKTGFNHRHHPAIWKAHELCRQGAVGPPMFIRAVYGHGGRPGYDKEWRANPDLAGGGELLDQGVHVVDLCRWFMGDFVEAVGFTNTYFWDLGHFSGADLNPQSTIRNPQSEDNAFALLRTTDGRVAQFHTSWTQWKNRFSFELFGHAGYVRVEGLGGSYGVETLTIGRRRPESGPPIEKQFEFPGPDLSWQAEWREFTSAICENRQPLANGEDGLETMRLIAAIYESAWSGQVVHLETR
jgi:predicted dehydrogenase